MYINETAIDAALECFMTGVLLLPILSSVNILMPDKQMPPTPPAEADCMRKGGHLAVIHNIQEEIFITGALHSLNYHGHGVWIGLTDKEQEGTFVWSTGNERRVNRRFKED